MLFIAVCYLGAAVSFGLEAKWMWCGVAISWGVGNALIGILSK